MHTLHAKVNFMAIQASSKSNHVYFNVYKTHRGITECVLASYVAM